MNNQKTDLLQIDIFPVIKTVDNQIKWAQDCTLSLRKKTLMCCFGRGSSKKNKSYPVWRPTPSTST